MPPPTNERRSSTPAILAYVCTDWTEAARGVALPRSWFAVTVGLLLASVRAHDGRLMQAREPMRRAPRRAKHRRLSLPDRIAQHPREYARDGPVSMAVGQNLATWATCSIHKQDSSRRFSCNDTKVLLRVWFGSGVMGNEGTKRGDVLMQCRAGKLAGTRTLRLQQAERAGTCDRVVRGVPLDRYCETPGAA